MKILILGATGMIGNTVFRYLASTGLHDVYGTARSDDAKRYFALQFADRLVTGIDVLDDTALRALFARVKPDVVINCVGVVKQRSDANDAAITLPLNAELPHRLAALCAEHGARLIQISTDCVFTGNKGNYTEADAPDASDLYGTSKRDGEITDQSHVITVRTSTVGPELREAHGLLAWFLSQHGMVKGFTHAIYSGVPSVELGRILHDYILPDPSLNGLYHVAGQPIDKYNLIKLFAKTYGKDIRIEPSSDLVIDRSLNADKFRAATGYAAPDWPTLVERMAAFK